MKSIPLEIDANKILLAFAKVQCCTPVYWRNQGGAIRKVRPEHPTFLDVIIDNDDSGYIQHLNARGWLDVWTPMVTFQLTANHSITYSGEQAIKLEKAYRIWLLSKHTKRKNKPCNQQQDLI